MPDGRGLDKRRNFREVKPPSRVHNEPFWGMTKIKGPNGYVTCEFHTYVKQVGIASVCIIRKNENIVE